MAVDDKNVTVGKYCGNETGKEVLLGGDYAVMTFHSDETEQRKGFIILFTVVQPSKCNLSTIRETLIFLTLTI